MAERNVSLLEDSVTGLKTSNGLKLSTVTGGTSTDNAIVRFDGTTGNVQNSGVTIDDNNNVGIGVTPNAWHTTTKSIDVGSISSIMGSNNNTALVSNAYYNSSASWVYKTTGYASLYQTNNGTHQWLTAPSGTAGNSINFTQAMTLDASGNLLTNNVVLPYNSSDAYGYKQASSNGIWYGRVVPFSSDGAMLLESQYAANSGGFRFNVNGVQKAKIDASGNLLLTSGTGGLGYGTGAGGTVTQATSKSTNVTLNKPFGQITMNSAALAAGTEVYFNLNNSLITTTDVLLVSVDLAAAVYSVIPYTYSAGVVGIAVKNTSADSRSDAVVIRFAIMKGATA